MPARRKIIKTLPNGYAAPYPDELVHHGYLFLKHSELAEYSGKETGGYANIFYKDYVEYNNMPAEEQDQIKRYITTSIHGSGIIYLPVTVFDERDQQRST